MAQKYGFWNANGSLAFGEHVKDKMLIEEQSSSSLKSVQILKKDDDGGASEVLMDKFVAMRDRDIGLQRKEFFRAKDTLTSDGGDFASAKNKSVTGTNLQSESARAGSQLVAGS